MTLTKVETTRYNACMRLFLIIVLAVIAIASMLAFIGILFFAPTPAKAENAVLPPPAVSESASGAADTHAADVTERAPDLNKELQAPDKNSNVDVRSYLRKDGARVTEYSLHGQIYEVKVQPAGDLPAYYLYRNKAGHLERRRPGAQPMVTPPSWILQKF